MEHTQAAITHGEVGHAGVLLEHAQATPGIHTEEALSPLNAAIESDKNNNAQDGVAHAQKALEHLEKAAQPKQ